MGKLKLTPTASGTMPTQALVDAVNECEGCEGTGSQSIPMPGRSYLSTPCPFCTLIRKALEPFTKEAD